jgi:hypothetical protein
MAEYGNKPKGRVLRVKTGYNPNSSSVGSQIPTFFFFAVASGVCTVIALQVLKMIGIHIRKKKDSIDIEKKQ